MCGSGVLEVKNRRRLESAKSKHCRDGIIALCRSIAVDLERDVCKKCFLEVGKYQALKRQYEYLEADLKSKLSRTLQPSLSEPLHRHHSSRHYPSNHRHHSNLRHHSSFVNYEGKVGQNISSDLHMEHLNKSCEETMLPLYLRILFFSR